MIEVRFDADEDRDSPETAKEVYIPLEDDSIDENLYQYFFALLEVVDAIGEIDPSANNVAKCTIVDNNEGKHCNCCDSICIYLSIGCRVGFVRDEYVFPEPDTYTSVHNVTVIKEGGCVTERTYGIAISIAEPSNNITAATIETRNSSRGFDYNFDIVRENFLNLTFSPDEQELSVSFHLNGDNLPEKTEAFQISCSPMDGYPTFKHPATTYLSTQIQITDNDRKWTSVKSIDNGFILFL